MTLENKNVYAISFFDALKKNKAPLIQIRDDRTGNEKIIYDPEQKRDYFEKSDETNQKIRYGVELSDGRIVSLDGLIRITEPKLWFSLENKLKGKKIGEKNKLLIRYTMTYEDLVKISKDLFDDLLMNDITQFDLGQYKAKKYLQDSGHFFVDNLQTDLKTKDDKIFTPYNYLSFLYQQKEKEDFYNLHKQEIDNLKLTFGVTEDMFDLSEQTINKIIGNLQRNEYYNDLFSTPKQIYEQKIKDRITSVMSYNKQYEMKKDILKGGKADKLTLKDIADKNNVSLDYAQDQLNNGIKHELEHTNNQSIAQEIALDHLAESLYYYIALEKIEKELKDNKMENKDMENLYVNVLRYKPDGNTITNSKLKIKKLERLNNCFISEIPDYDDYYKLIYKLEKNNNVVYFEINTYRISDIENNIEQDVIDNYISKLINMINAKDTSEVFFVNLLQIEIAEKLGYNTNILKEIRELFLKQKREKEQSDAIKKEEEAKIFAKEEKERQIENLKKSFHNFKKGIAIDGEDAIDLAKHFDIELHPRTIGSIRDGKMGFRYDLKDKSIYYSFSGRNKNKKVNTDFLFDILKIDNFDKNETIEPEPIGNKDMENKSTSIGDVWDNELSDISIDYPNLRKLVSETTNFLSMFDGCKVEVVLDIKTGGEFSDRKEKLTMQGVLRIEYPSLAFPNFENKEIMFFEGQTKNKYKRLVLNNNLDNGYEIKSIKVLKLNTINRDYPNNYIDMIEKSFNVILDKINNYEYEGQFDIYSDFEKSAKGLSLAIMNGNNESDKAQLKEMIEIIEKERNDYPIKKALNSGYYENAIKEGKMTYDKVVSILKSKNIEIPNNILKLNQPEPIETEQLEENIVLDTTIPKTEVINFQDLTDEMKNLQSSGKWVYLYIEDRNFNEHNIYVNDGIFTFETKKQGGEKKYHKQSLSARSLLPILEAIIGGLGGNNAKHQDFSKIILKEVANDKFYKQYLNIDLTEKIHPDLIPEQPELLDPNIEKAKKFAIENNYEVDDVLYNGFINLKKTLDNNEYRIEIQVFTQEKINLGKYHNCSILEKKANFGNIMDKTTYSYQYSKDEEVSEDLDVILEYATKKEIQFNNENIKMETNIVEVSKDDWNELIPENEKYSKPVKSIAYKIDPKDKGLLKIMQPFLKDDPINPQMNGINFDEFGVTSSDGWRLLHLKANTDIRGIYFENVNSKFTGTETKNLKYPQYNNILPSTDKLMSSGYEKYEVDVLALKTYAEIVLRMVLYQKDATHKLRLSYGEKDEKLIGVSVKYIIEVCEAFLLLGHEKVTMLIGQHTEAIYFVLDKYELYETFNDKSYLLLMPMVLDDYEYYGNKDTAYGNEEKQAEFVYSVTKNMILSNKANYHKIDTKITKSMASEKSSIDVKELASIKSMINKTFAIPILEKILIEKDILYISDLENFYTTKVNGYKDGIYEVVGSSLQITDKEINEFPRMDKLDSSNKKKSICQINRKELVYLLDLAKQFVSDDELRPIMNGVHLYTEGENIYMASTDAHRLLKVKLQSFHIDSEFDIDIPIKYFKLLEYFTCDVVNVSIYGENDKWIELDCDDRALLVRNIQGRYPNVNSVIPINYTKSLKISTKLIKEAINYAQTYKDNKSFRRALEVYENGSLEIVAQSNDTWSKITDRKPIKSLEQKLEIETNEPKPINLEYITVAMPLMTEQENISFVVWLDLLKPLLGVGQESFNVYYTDLNRALVFELMPLSVEKLGMMPKQATKIKKQKNIEVDIESELENERQQKEAEEKRLAEIEMLERKEAKQKSKSLVKGLVEAENTNKGVNEKELLKQDISDLKMLLEIADKKDKKQLEQDLKDLIMLVQMIEDEKIESEDDYYTYVVKSNNVNGNYDVRKKDVLGDLSMSNGVAIHKTLEDAEKSAKNIARINNIQYKGFINK